MNLMNFRYIISALLFVIIVSKGNSDAGAKPHIFILHSYQSGHICGQPQHDGILAALHESGLDMNDEIELEAYFMDTKRRNNTPELIEAQAKIALRRIHRFKPDILG